MTIENDNEEGKEEQKEEEFKIKEIIQAKSDYSEEEEMKEGD